MHWFLPLLLLALVNIFHLVLIYYMSRVWKFQSLDKLQAFKNETIYNESGHPLYTALTCVLSVTCDMSLSLSLSLSLPQNSYFLFQT